MSDNHATAVARAVEIEREIASLHRRAAVSDDRWTQGSVLGRMARIAFNRQDFIKAQRFSTDVHARIGELRDEYYALYKALPPDRQLEVDKLTNR